MIDDTGNAWHGSDPSDVAAYLARYTATEEAYPATAFRLIRCPCRSIEFLVERSREVTKRTCLACNRSKFICRARSDWAEAVAEEGGEQYQCSGV